MQYLDPKDYKFYIAAVCTNPDCMTGECDNDSKRISAPGLQDGQAHQDTARQG
jgi:hypothetical protein